MPRPTSRALKALGLITILGGLLYGGHLWLNAGQESDPAVAPPAPAQPALATPDAMTPPTSPSGRLDARSVAQDYAKDRKAADARFKGRRMVIQGLVSQVEAGQGQVMLITLGAVDDAHPGLRAVLDGAALSSPVQAVAGQSLSLDCLNQGLVMEEPLLTDCRILP